MADRWRDRFFGHGDEHREQFETNERRLGGRGYGYREHEASWGPDLDFEGRYRGGEGYRGRGADYRGRGEEYRGGGGFPEGDRYRESQRSESRAGEAHGGPGWRGDRDRNVGLERDWDRGPGPMRYRGEEERGMGRWGSEERGSRYAGEGRREEWPEGATSRRYPTRDEYPAPGYERGAIPYRESGSYPGFEEPGRWQAGEREPGGDWGRGDWQRDEARGEWGRGRQEAWREEGRAYPRPRPSGRQARADERGPHAGRGPKGYERSDERIADEICEHLMRNPYIDPSEVSIEVDDGEVKLSGTVEDRWIKHQIEDVADSVLGVHDVHNRIRIARENAGRRETETERRRGEEEREVEASSSTTPARPRKGASSRTSASRSESGKKGAGRKGGRTTAKTGESAESSATSH